MNNDMGIMGFRSRVLKRKIIMKPILIFIVFFLISCKSENQNDKILEKEFLGFWAETVWKYKFKRDGTFIFKSEGHYGNSIDSGVYSILGNLIVLVPDTDWKVLDGVLKTKLEIISDSCLLDFNGNYYCSSYDLVNFYSDQESVFREKTISLLNSLRSVEDLKNEIILHRTDKEFDLFFTYDGIIVVDKEGFHSFILESTDGLIKRSYLLFLVRKNPFEIYQYGSKGNSLILLYQ